MWLKFAIGVGTGTGIGVGIRGGSLYEVLAWSALSTGLSAAIGSGAFWRGAWGGVRVAAGVAAPPAWILAKDIGYVAGQTGRAIASTPSARVIAKGAGAVTAGYVIGAVTGTAIVSQAEKRDIVYEGATADVIDFYTGEGQYWDQGTNPTPGYFNIPGNASLIAKHYWNKWT